MVAKPAWASKPTSGNTTARSEEPHNIFRPASAQSTDDELYTPHHMMDDFGNALSSSINKLQNLQNQLSGVNRQDGNTNGNNLALDTFRSTDTLTPAGSSPPLVRKSSVDDFIQDIMDWTPRHDKDWDVLNSSRSVQSSKSSGRRAEGIENFGPVSLANNISRPGQKQKEKATLSSMENSYQNIKHKTPVNQVRDTTESSGQSRSLRSDSKTSQPSTVQTKTFRPKPGSNKDSKMQNVEDYIGLFNASALKIQKWYRRHKTRHAAAEAAIRRLLSQKKQASFVLFSICLTVVSKQ